MVSTNFSKVTINSTNHSLSNPASVNYSGATINSTNFKPGRDSNETDVLLLQTGDKLLLQNGTNNLLLNEGRIEAISVNYSSVTVNSTNYS